MVTYTYQKAILLKRKKIGQNRAFSHKVFMLVVQKEKKKRKKRIFSGSKSYDAFTHQTLPVPPWLLQSMRDESAFTSFYMALSKYQLHARLKKKQTAQKTLKHNGLKSRK